MDLQKLESLINMIIFINHYKQKSNVEHLLEDNLSDSIQEVKQQFGGYLEDHLFDVYDDYFEDDEIKPLDQYFSRNGVTVDGEELGLKEVNVYIKPYPLRIEVANPERNFRSVVWQEAA